MMLNNLYSTITNQYDGIRDFKQISESPERP